MKLRVLVIVICLIIGKKGASQDEAPNSNFETNTIEVYYPTYYFFDNLNMRLENPLGNFGLSYYRYRSDEKLGWHVGVDIYQSFRAFEPDPFLGDVLERNAAFICLGLDKRWVLRNRFTLLWFGEINHRNGQELWYVGGTGINFSYGQRKLMDFGLSIGAKVNYRFSFGLVAILSVKQSFYYYRFDRGIDYWTFEDGSPRNVLNLNFGLGWNF